MNKKIKEHFQPNLWLTTINLTKETKKRKEATGRIANFLLPVIQEKLDSLYSETVNINDVTKLISLFFNLRLKQDQEIEPRIFS